MGFTQFSHAGTYAGGKFIYTITSSKMVTRGIKISMPDSLRDSHSSFIFNGVTTKAVNGNIKKD